MQLSAVKLLAVWLDVPVWEFYFGSSKGELELALIAALRTPGNLRCSIWAASALLKLDEPPASEDVELTCDSLTITADRVSDAWKFRYIWREEVDIVLRLEAEARRHHINWTVDWAVL